MERDRRPRYALEFIGFPTWEIELVDDIVKASENNWAHNKVIMSFKASFSRPPQDSSNRVVYINRTFSAPLHTLTKESIGTGENNALNLIELMFELLLLPFFCDGFDHIIAGVKRIADTHRADLSASTPVGLLMNINIYTFLHEIPSVYFDYEGGDLGHVTDIRDLLMILKDRICMSTELSLIIFGMMKERRFFNGLDLLVLCLKIRACDDSVKSLERVTVDVD